VRHRLIASSGSCVLGECCLILVLASQFGWLFLCYGGGTYVRGRDHFRGFLCDDMFSPSWSQETGRFTVRCHREVVSVPQTSNCLGFRCSITWLPPSLLMRGVLVLFCAVQFRRVVGRCCGLCCRCHVDISSRGTVLVEVRGCGCDDLFGRLLLAASLQTVVPAKGLGLMFRGSCSRRCWPSRTLRCSFPPCGGGGVWDFAGGGQYPESAGYKHAA
jgi:hypothetical protein